MKQKINMTPDEFRSFVAAEVESIRSELERLRFTAERISEPAASRIAPDPAPVASQPSFSSLQILPEQNKAQRG